MHPFENKVREFIKQKNQEAEAFRAAVPAEYQKYVIDLEQAKRMSKPDSWSIPSDMRGQCYESAKGFYVKYIQPYFGVAGLQAHFNALMDESGSNYQLTSDIVEVGKMLAFKGRLVVTNSDGKVTLDITDWAAVNIGGGGVDATNPIENAATSLKGRLLRSKAGNFLPEIATAEEMVIATQLQESQSKETTPAAGESKATEAFYEVLVIADEGKAFSQSGKLKGQEVTVQFPEGADAGTGEAYIVRGALNEEGVLVIDACVSCTGTLEVKATKGRPAKKVKDGQDRYTVYADTILGTVQLIAESPDVFLNEPFEVAILQENINKGVLILKVGKVA